MPSLGIAATLSRQFPAQREVPPVAGKSNGMKRENVEF